MSLIDLPSGPLPHQPHKYQQWLQEQPDLLRVYNLVLQAESHANQKPPPQEDLVSARVIGYLLIELFDRTWAFTEEPWRCLLKELLQKDQEQVDYDDTVFAVGKRYRDHFLRMFRTSPTRYPTPLDPSRPSFDRIIHMTEEHLEAAGSDYKASRLKAFARDNYRCTLTGLFDQTSVANNVELGRKVHDLCAGTHVVNACHILSEPITQNVGPDNNSTENEYAYPAAALSILRTFGLEELYGNFTSQNGIHNVRNLLLLEPNCHRRFGNLDLWLEHTETEPNRYYVNSARGERLFYFRLFNYLPADNGRPYVTFSKTPMDPHPQLLDLHAVCARVAYMSGAAEAFDELERDAESTHVLAGDGSSARLLDHFLTPLAGVHGVS